MGRTPWSAQVPLDLPEADGGVGRAPGGPPHNYAILHPFATTPDKTWAADGFLAVAQHLKQSGLDPIFIGGGGDDFSPFRAFHTISGAPLSEIKSVIAAASLFVGNDSGPAHMAAALGVPAVVIFGASDAAIWGPWRTVSEVVTAPSAVAQVIDALARLRVAV